MLELAKEINKLLLDNESVKEYLHLKEELNKDLAMRELREKLDKLRKEICKDKSKDSSEYFDLLNEYNKDYRVQIVNKLEKELREYFVEISDILTLK